MPTTLPGSRSSRSQSRSQPSRTDLWPRAVDGAVALDSLVVAPAGNDGPGGPGFGSIAGPGGAPAALTVGAVDLRTGDDRIDSVIRVGLHVLLRRPLELLTANAPLEDRRSSSSRYAQPSGVLRQRWYEPCCRAGGSRRTGESPRRRAAERAAKAGAAVVVLADDELAAGVWGLDPELTAPVVSVPASIATIVRTERAAGRTAWLSVGRSTGGASTARGRPASFSSWGLAFGGQLKPDASAAGVGVATAAPGADEAGVEAHDRERLERSGSRGGRCGRSACSGAAVLQRFRTAQCTHRLRTAARARPGRRAGNRRRGCRPGGGGRDRDAPTLTFGRGEGDGWEGRRVLVLRSMSTRPLVVDLSARPLARRISLDVALASRQPPPGCFGGSCSPHEGLQADGRAGCPRDASHSSARQPAAPWLPWRVLLAPPARSHRRRRALRSRFAPSDLTPTVLAVRVGTIARVRGRDIVQPALRLDVFLRDGEGRTLGLLARLRDVLPGRYAFGITGRGPDGRSLAPGRYELRLVAWPAAGGKPLKLVRFRFK